MTRTLSLTDEYYCLGVCLAGFLFGMIYLSVLQLQRPSLKSLLSFSGLYSGIFALYLQCHARTAKANYILFYALCFLYMLSIATVAFDIVSFVITTPVSKNQASFFSLKRKLCANRWLGRTSLKITPLILFNSHYTLAATSSPSPS